MGNIALFGIVALMAWACWALAILQVGWRLLPEPQTVVDIGQLVRTIGFASTPGLLRVFGFMPSVMIPVFVVSSIWMLLAMVVGVGQVLDYRGTARAVVVCTARRAVGLGTRARFGSRADSFMTAVWLI